MNNSSNRKFIVAALTFFLVLSIGYAVFSETITIEGTATAQMEGGLELECANGIISDIGMTSEELFALISGNSKQPSREEGYGETSCIVEGSSISVSADLKYPLASKAYTVKVKNTTSNSVLFDVANMNITGANDVEGTNACNDNVCMIFNYSNGVALNTFTSIEPGATHYVPIILYWHGEDDTNDGVARTATFTLSLPFKQAE